MDGITNTLSKTRFETCMKLLKMIFNNTSNYILILLLGPQVGPPYETVIFKNRALYGCLIDCGGSGVSFRCVCVKNATPHPRSSVYSFQVGMVKMGLFQTEWYLHSTIG